MLIVFYKKYPNSPLASFVSVLSSIFLLSGCACIYLVIHGLGRDGERGEAATGLFFIAFCTGLFFLFRFLARRISERKAAKEASKNAANPPLFTELHREDKPGYAQPSSNSPAMSPEPKPTAKAKKRGSKVRKVFGIILMLAPVIAFIGSIANGSLSSMGIAYYAALIAMFLGGVLLLEKSNK